MFDLKVVSIQICTICISLLHNVSKDQKPQITSLLAIPIVTSLNHPLLIATYLSISVQLNCASVNEGHFNIKITPYRYDNDDDFKGIIHVHNNFEDANAFSDACEMTPGADDYSVAHPDSSLVVPSCADMAVSCLIMALSGHHISNLPEILLITMAQQ